MLSVKNTVVEKVCEIKFDPVKYECKDIVVEAYEKDPAILRKTPTFHIMPTEPNNKKFIGFAKYLLERRKVYKYYEMSIDLQRLNRQE